MKSVALILLCLVVVQVRGMAVTMEPESMDHDHTDHDHDHTDDDHDHGGDDHSGHSMKMYFHHTSHATILFKGWHTMVYWELFMSCLAVMVMAALYEGYKTLRENIRIKMTPTTILPVTMNGNGNKTAPSQSTEQLAVVEPYQPQPKSFWAGLTDGSHLVQGAMHIGQVFISYCLMLIFMTYNIWLCIAVCLGAGLGYWLFGQNRSMASREANEHCH